MQDTGVESGVGAEDQLTRLFGLVLALAVATTAQAGPYKRPPLQRQAVGSDGCPAAFYRGSGGNCIHNPDYPKPYRPDPYWTPCDYSLGPQYPEGCGGGD